MPKHYRDDNVTWPVHKVIPIDTYGDGTLIEFIRPTHTHTEQPAYENMWLESRQWDRVGHHSLVQDFTDDGFGEPFSNYYDAYEAGQVVRCEGEWMRSNVQHSTYLNPWELI